jgi:hypothetical protein
VVLLATVALPATTGQVVFAAAAGPASPSQAAGRTVRPL